LVKLILFGYTDVLLVILLLFWLYYLNGLPSLMKFSIHMIINVSRSIVPNV